ncbi:MAG: type VI secretion system baseplate subunit TssF [Syntrophorhabdus sp.]
MFNKYYQQELQNLRELAVEFSKTHPIAAPMLSGPKPDPDVERLLEGVAFLNGLLQQKLDDEFPQLIHSLMDVVFPHYVKPIPSLSIVSFRPKPGLNESVIVPAGTSLSSTLIDGTACTFRTCFDVETHPLRVISLDTRAAVTTQPEALTMLMEYTGPGLDRWKPGGVTFLPGGTYSQGTDLFTLLTRYLDRVTIRPLEGGSPCVLPADCVKAAGFDPNNSLFPFPARSFYGYRLLQEYFIMPSKFLFLSLTGWEKWTDRGTGSRFEVVFEFLPSGITLPQLSVENVVLACTPVINLFPMDAEPVLLDHRNGRVRIRPSAKNYEHFHVYDVTEVVGYSRGSVEKTTYLPLDLFGSIETGDPTYQMMRYRSPVDDSNDVFLAFPYNTKGPEPRVQTLSISLLCTNGQLPEKLQFGDISVETSDSPALLTFSNVIPPSYYIEPPHGRNILWKFLSHLTLNYLSVANADNLRELLTLYILEEGRDRTRIAANSREIQGIEDLSLEAVRRLVRGNMVQGQKITITANRSYYASQGNLLLFLSVLDHFFGAYSAMHSFTQMNLRESTTGECFSWPQRMGTRCLV